MRFWSFFVWVCFLAGSAGLTAARNDFTAWFLLTLSVIIGGLILSVRFLSLMKVEAVRKEESLHCLSGEELSIEITITYRSWLPPLWIIVRDQWPHAEGKLLFPWFSRTFTYRYNAVDLPRGVYRSSGIEVITGDIFGLITVRKLASANLTLTVFPRTLNYNEWISFRGNIGDELSLLTGNIRNSMSLSEIRDYAVGDPMRQISWKASARVEGLKTKQTEPEVQSKMLILLDNSELSYGFFATRAASSARCESKGSKISNPRLINESCPLFEKCVQAAATLIDYAKAGNQAVDLHTQEMNQRQSIHPFSAELSDRSVQLAEVKVEGEDAFNIFMTHESALVKPYTAIYCITSLIDELFVEAAMQLLKGRNKLFVIYVYSNSLSSIHSEQMQRLSQLASAGCGIAALSCDSRKITIHGGSTYVSA